MSSVQEMQRVDRELFLELIESPVNPGFLHMSTPLKGYDPMFYLINIRSVRTAPMCFQLKDNSSTE